MLVGDLGAGRVVALVAFGSDGEPELVVVAAMRLTTCEARAGLASSS